VIGVDLAKNSFQVHGATMGGHVKFRRKLSRAQFPSFMAAQHPAVVVMQACAAAHHWARALLALGHEVRLIAPIYVKPFVKRQKNDAADAEAVVEAAPRPEMRFVEPKGTEQQARALLFRTAERRMRAIALGRKNDLFFGSEAGGKAAAIACTLTETAKINAIDPVVWLADTFARIPDYKFTGVDDLLPWHWNR
jgi:hypothetical protein